MGSLAFLRHDEEMDIPRPVCAREGDVFQVVEFEEPPKNMAPGSLFVVQLGREEQGWNHIVLVDDCYLLARLFFKSNGLKVRVCWLHEDEEDGEYDYKSLNIFGCVVELYPTGKLSVRVVQFQEGLEYHPAYDLPIYLPKELR